MFSYLSDSLFKGGIAILLVTYDYENESWREHVSSSVMGDGTYLNPGDGELACTSISIWNILCLFSSSFFFSSSNFFLDFLLLFFLVLISTCFLRSLWSSYYLLRTASLSCLLMLSSINLFSIKSTSLCCKFVYSNIWPIFSWSV